PETTPEVPEAEPSPEEPEPSEEPTEPEGPQSLTPEQLDKRDKAVERAFTTYTNRVTTLYEDDAVNLIPLSLSPSAPYGFFHKLDVGRVPDEITGPVMELFGITREAEYEPDPTAHTCPVCDGKGRTKTGSLVPNEETRTCPECTGRGWIGAQAARVNGQAEGVPVPVAAGVSDSPEPPPDVDGFGTPRLLDNGMVNPNWGRSPQY